MDELQFQSSLYPAAKIGQSHLLIRTSDLPNAGKQLNDLFDAMITKINIQYYSDLRDCLIKRLME